MIKKRDLILAAFIGLANGFFFWFILNQINKGFPFDWLLIMTICPFLGALGLFLANLIGKKIAVVYQVAKFFLVGTLNTFIDLGVLNFLIFLTGIARGNPYSFFKAGSFLVATINSYIWNRYWTFEKKDKKLKPEEFFKFFLVTFVGFLINVGVASFVVNAIGPQFGLSETIWATIGAVVAAFFAFLWNFLGSKFIVFK